MCCDWFSRSFVGCFVTVLLLLSFDFWSVKVRPLTCDTTAPETPGLCFQMVTVPMQVADLGQEILWLKLLIHT